MLLNSCLEDIFWAEAVNTATYLHSRSPSSLLNGRTPYEVLTGNKPELQHLQRFGSAAHKLIPPEQRSGKFSARSRQCPMMGYVHDTTKIWRLWDPIECRIIQASNVKFDEALIEGKRVIDVPSSDTLHNLANPESQSVDLSEDEDLERESRNISSGLFTEVQQNIMRDKRDSCSPILKTTDTASELTVDPLSYTDAITSDQHNG